MGVKLHPLKVKPWQAIVAIVGLIASIAGSMTWIQPIYDWAVPGGVWLNARLASIGLTVLLVMTFLILNYLWRTDVENWRKRWRSECDERERAQWREKDCYNRLTLSEQQRMMDFPTGLPNGEQFKKDTLNYYSEHPQVKAVQVALIDIRNFKKVNENFGHNNADILLRRLAQHIHATMRRNEYMYRYPESSAVAVLPNTYRRYCGGDEFLLLIEGDQAEALGFINRLHQTFMALTPLTTEWLGGMISLSFICSLVPFERTDSPDRVMEKLGQCYTVAAHSDKPFSICWFDEFAENRAKADKDEKRRDFYVKTYAKTRELFEVRELKERLAVEATGSTTSKS